MQKKRKQKVPTKVRYTRRRRVKRSKRKIKFLEDNGYNLSNLVPPHQVLRSRLHPAFPILFLPEYIRRRHNTELVHSAGAEGNFRLPYSIYNCYQDFLGNKKKEGEVYPSSRGANVLLEKLVRVIIVPLSPSLISKVSYRTSHTNGKQNKGSTPADASVAARSLGKNPSNSTINIYKKVKPKSKLVTQSLEDLIDGVISTLVHRKKRIRYHSKEKERKYFARGKNVLCEGYDLASNDYSRRYSCKSPPNKKRRICAGMAAIVPHNSNMKPGIVCNRPSCSSYARSSPLMRAILNLIGDDLMREMMLNCMVFIPIEDNIQDIHTDDNPQLEKGNYFQLSGPSLATVKKNVIPENIHDDIIEVSKVPHRSMKRSGDNKSVIEKETTLSGRGRKHAKVGEKTLRRKAHNNLNSQWTVPKHSMLFADSFKPEGGLPLSHVMNMKLEYGNILSSRAREVKLLNSMVHLEKRKKRWLRLRKRGTEIAEEIIKKQSKTDYNRLLNRTCPLPDSSLCDLPRLVASFSPTKSVVSFFKAIMKQVFPIQFWGSLHNFQVVLSTMETFLSMKRKESMTMEQLMRGVRILDVTWLFQSLSRKAAGKRKRSDHEAATLLMRNIMRWLYCDFIIPIVKSSYYATSTQFSGDKIIYYRKPVWFRIRKIAWETQLKLHFSRIETGEAVQRLQRQTLGHSRLQLLPKETGIRPIALLSKPIKFPSSTEGVGKSMNTRLHEISMKPHDNFSANRVLQRSLDVLTYEFGRQPSRFGAGVSGMDSVHSRFLTFVQENLDREDSNLFFVSVDIRHCFDNINQVYLLDLIKKVMRREEYVLQQHTVLRSTSSQNDVKALLYKSKCTVEPGNVTNFINAASACSSKFNQSIVVDNVRCNVAKKKRIYDLIQEHLSSNLLMMRERHGNAFFLQRDGIPQGSVLSTILCNYYYGDIEQELLEGVFARHDRYLLVRIVDDFLLVTPDKRVSQRFFSKLSKGNSRFGVKINPHKTRTNYDMQVPNISNPTTRGGTVNTSGQRFFSWCGLLVNTRSCEIRIDYSRFAGTNVFDSMATDGIKTGTSLPTKMKFFVKPRCQPLLYDSRLNSNANVATNFYQMIVLSAIKTSYFIRRGLGGGVVQNINFIESCIVNNILFAHGIIRSRLRALSRQDGASMEDVFQHWLNKRDALWLGTHAFQQVFVHSSDRDLLSLQVFLQKYCKECKAKAILKEIAEAALHDIELKQFHLNLNE